MAKRMNRRAMRARAALAAEMRRLDERPASLADHVVCRWMHDWAGTAVRLRPADPAAVAVWDTASDWGGPLAGNLADVRRWRWLGCPIR